MHQVIFWVLILMDCIVVSVCECVCGGVMVVGGWRWGKDHKWRWHYA